MMPAMRILVSSIGAAWRMADEALAPVLRAAGVTVDSDRLHIGDLYLHPMPASLDLEPPPEPVRRVRPADASPAVAAIGDASVLRTAITRALTDRFMVDAACEVRDEIGDAAGPGRAADWIEALVQSP